MLTLIRPSQWLRKGTRFHLKQGEIFGEGGSITIQRYYVNNEQPGIHRGYSVYPSAFLLLFVLRTIVSYYRITTYHSTWYPVVIAASGIIVTHCLSLSCSFSSSSPDLVLFPSSFFVFAYSNNILSPSILTHLLTAAGVWVCGPPVLVFRPFLLFIFFFFLPLPVARLLPALVFSPFSYFSLSYSLPSRPPASTSSLPLFFLLSLLLVLVLVLSCLGLVCAFPPPSPAVSS